MRVLHMQKRYFQGLGFQSRVGGTRLSLLNLFQDGQRIVACRYGTAPAETQEEGQEVPLGATLYLSSLTAKMRRWVLVEVRRVGHSGVGSRWVASPDDPQTYRMKKGVAA